MSTIGDNKFDLIIIGGGVSGLNSALNLLKQNFQGKIGLLEARNRFGGRIFTTRTKIEEEKIEIGANWIHGIISNPIYEILYKNQIIDSNLECNKKFYNIQAKTLDGEDIDPKWIHKVYDAYSKIINSASKFLNNSDDLTEELIGKFNDSLGKYLQNEIEKWIEKEFETETIINESSSTKSIKSIIRGLFDSLIKRETCISGCHSMNDVSLKYFDQYKEFLGGNITIPRGYYSLIQVILDEIERIDNDRNEQSRKFHYFLETEIEKINWPGLSSSSSSSNDQQQKSSTTDYNNLIKIKCSNGSIFECKHLIITITLGCLKKLASNLFEPKLPEYKLNCIHRMGFNVVDKIFMEYSSKNIIFETFTKDGVTVDEIMLLWNCNGNDGNDNSDDNDDKPWYYKIYSIYRITDHCIQLWVSGNEALLLENLNEEQINDDLTKQFRLIFKNSKFPKADNLIITRWGLDPYSLGSYSFIQPNSSVDDIEKLAAPIYLKPDDDLPVIVFGGEATHTEYFSTVHGAYLSGIRCANYFLQ